MILQPTLKIRLLINKVSSIEPLKINLGALYIATSRTMSTSEIGSGAGKGGGGGGR